MSATATAFPATPTLEPDARAFADAASTPPFIYELSPTQARKVLDDVQAAPIDKLVVDERWVTVPAGAGEIRVRVVRPLGSTGTLTQATRGAIAQAISTLRGALFGS